MGSPHLPHAVGAPRSVSRSSPGNRRPSRVFMPVPPTHRRAASALLRRARSLPPAARRLVPRRRLRRAHEHGDALARGGARAVRRVLRVRLHRLDLAHDARRHGAAEPARLHGVERRARVPRRLVHVDAERRRVGLQALRQLRLGAPLRARLAQRQRPALVVVGAGGGGVVVRDDLKPHRRLQRRPTPPAVHRHAAHEHAPRRVRARDVQLHEHAVVVGRAHAGLRAVDDERVRRALDGRDDRVQRLEQVRGRRREREDAVTNGGHALDRLRLHVRRQAEHVEVRDAAAASVARGANARLQQTKVLEGGRKFPYFQM